jgi:hypothetical protein
MENEFNLHFGVLGEDDVRTYKIGNCKNPETWEEVADMGVESDYDCIEDQLDKILGLYQYLDQDIVWLVALEYKEDKEREHDEIYIHHRVNNIDCYLKSTDFKDVENIFVFQQTSYEWAYNVATDMREVHRLGRNN